MMPALPHIFLRHPPLPQMRGICYGRLDVALEPQIYIDAVSGLRAAPDSERLWRLPILSSAAQRCSELAHACARVGTDNDARRPRIEPRLLEMNFGAWEGIPWSEVPQADLDQWADDVAGFRPPGGECFNDLIHRVGMVLAELRTPHLIVTHAGVIRASMHVLHGMDPIDAASIQVPYLQPIKVHSAAESSS